VVADPMGKGRTVGHRLGSSPRTNGRWHTTDRMAGIDSGNGDVWRKGTIGETWPLVG
jgi:hypothetical protein